MVVLDTHIWYWWINLEDDRLKPELLSVIDNASQVGIASVSCFELALAHRRGRLQLPLPINQWLPLALEGSGVELLPLSAEIALRAVQLSEVHRDPFDRMIIATALELEAELISLDGSFSEYPELNGRLITR